jgi:hypothetical protein
VLALLSLSTGTVFLFPLNSDEVGGSGSEGGGGSGGAWGYRLLPAASCMLTASKSPCSTKVPSSRASTSRVTSTAVSSLVTAQSPGSKTGTHGRIVSAGEMSSSGKQEGGGARLKVSKKKRCRQIGRRGQIGDTEAQR